MIDSITFSGGVYGKTAKEKLAEWSKKISKSQVISVSINNNGYITVFYWKGWWYIMVIIEYSEHGIPNADLQSEWLAEQIYTRYTNYRSELDYTYHTSTDSLITAFRLLVAEGKIPKEDIKFRFKDEFLKIDSYGQIERFPKGFVDSEMDRLYRLMKIQIDKNWNLSLDKRLWIWYN